MEIDRDTLIKWRKDDGEFNKLIEMAQMEAVTEKICRIHAAGDTDWKADAWGLERDKRTREHYGAPAGAGGTKIEVFVNVQRGTAPQEPPEESPDIVDVTPEEEQ